MKFSAFGLTIETSLDFSSSLEYSIKEPDVIISESDHIDMKNFIETNLYRGGIRAKIKVVSDCIYLHWENIGVFEISKGKNVSFARLGSTDDSLKLFILSEVLGIVLLQRGHYLLHSSGVKNKSGQAILFLGESGSGKSTTAAALIKTGFTILTDDLAVIKITDNIPYIVPAFNQYKVWSTTIAGLELNSEDIKPSLEGKEKYFIKQKDGDFLPSQVSIKEIWCIKENLKTERKLTQAEASIELLKHFALPGVLLKSNYLLNHFKHTEVLVKTVPIFIKPKNTTFESLKHWLATKIDV